MTKRSPRKPKAVPVLDTEFEDFDIELALARAFAATLAEQPLNLWPTFRPQD